MKILQSLDYWSELPTYSKDILNIKREPTFQEETYQAMLDDEHQQANLYTTLSTIPQKNR